MKFELVQVRVVKMREFLVIRDDNILTSIFFEYKEEILNSQVE